MATKAAAKKPRPKASPARRKPVARRKPAPRAKPAPKPSKRPKLGDHAQDLIGLALLAAALLVALAVFADLAGPAGRVIDDGLTTAFGGGRFALPILLATAGGFVLWRRPLDDAVRLGVGLVLVLATSCGLLRNASADGGAVGDFAAEPMRGVIGPWGTGLVLITVLVGALLVIGRTTVRDAVTVAGRAGRGAGRLLAQLGRMGSDDADAAPAPVSVPEPVATKPAPPAPPPPPEPAPAVSVHVPEDAPPSEQLAIDLGPAAEPGTWKLPSLSLLRRGEAQRIDERMVEAGGRALEAALAAHGVETRLVGMTVGPTVTRYELELGPGVKVARVTNLHKDIAYAMASADVRIRAPIPGRSAIGVEVPNTQRQLVLLGDVLASPDAPRAVHPLEAAMGRDIAGRAIMV
ncbi:MAG: DNA translocase FtsK 4TM domain-containing protein, partial [Acidimicrobiales bacterium]